MTHPEADQLFPAYQKGAMSRAQVKEFHEHLKDCESCQARFRLQNALGKAQAQGPAPGIASPEIQASIARNRDLLVKLLLLLVLAWAVLKFRR